MLRPPPLPPQALIRAMLHLVNQEYEALAEDFVTLGFLPPGSDRSLIVPALSGVYVLGGGRGDRSFIVPALSGVCGGWVGEWGTRQAVMCVVVGWGGGVTWHVPHTYSPLPPSQVCFSRRCGMGCLTYHLEI